MLLTVAELFGANARPGRFVQFYADSPKMGAGILYTGLMVWLAYLQQPPSGDATRAPICQTQN